MTLHDIVGRWLFTLAIDTARYVVPAGLAFSIVWVWGRERFRSRRTGRGELDLAKIRHDLGWSVSTILLFSIFGVVVWAAGHAGILRRYPAVEDHGWLWFFASIGVLVVLQDAYFYWTHRAMHHRQLYRFFHRVHHVSRSPSPFTAYAFAVPEAAVHALFVPLVWLVLPLHELAVFSFLFFMITRNVLGHLSVELYRSGFSRHGFWGWHTTTTHHAMHHAHAGTNYGLYFTFWDRVMGTIHPAYDETFEHNAGRRQQATGAGSVDDARAPIAAVSPHAVLGGMRRGSSHA